VYQLRMMFTEEICIYLTCILVAIVKNAVFLAIFLCYIFACSKAINLYISIKRPEEVSSG
jgi:hypothetical protein